MNGGGMFGMIVSKAFADADKDKSGHIDREETEAVLKKYSKDLRIDKVSREDVDAFFKELDKDESGTIDEKEFGKLIQTVIKTKSGEINYKA